MKRITFLVLTALTFLLVFSCAKDPAIDTTQNQQEAFRLWMAKYYPQAEEHSSGLFVEWLERSNSHITLSVGNWMKINYTAKNQSGNYLVSRSADIAKQLGYFAYTTRYIPEYLMYYPTNLYTSMAYGQVYMLREMQEGDSVRIYMPPGMGYLYGLSTSSDDAAQFYSGTSIGVYSPVIMEMKLSQVVKDPTENERLELERYIADSMGIYNPADSITLGVYLKKFEERPKGDTITADSTIKVWYAGYFTDGFLFDTNIDSIAEKHHVTVSNSGGELTFSVGNSSFVDGFTDALYHMRRGEKARVIMLSGKGYSLAGDLPKIPPYSSLVFDIHVVDDNDED